MSNSEVEETSWTYARFRSAMSDRQNHRNLTILSTDANGTHFYYENAKGDRRFGVISDLTKPVITLTHNLLSATHLDTNPQSPPLDPSGIIGTDGVGKWTEIDAAAGFIQILATTGAGIPAFWTSPQSVLPNAVFLESRDTTQQSATIPNVDTVLKTVTLGASISGTSLVIISSDGFVQFGALSTNQSILLKLKRNGVQVGQTMQTDAALGAVSKIPFSMRTVGAVIAANDVYTLTISAAAADVNTSVFCNSLIVESVV